MKSYLKSSLLAGLMAVSLLGAAVSNAHAEDLEIMLTNMSSQALYVFQASPSGVESWEEDVLGDAILPSGNEVPVIIADGRDVCFYDMRFIMENDAVLEAYEYDLCETESFTLYDSE